MAKYDESLNLPKTDFPMRANLPKREAEFLQFWDEQKIYEQVQKKNQNKPKFILHDGPPYANGSIHLGTTLNKILKDFIVKYYSMSGYDAPYVPGWDTHGLPIEQQAIKNLGLDRSKIDVVEFRNHCRDYALKYVDVQREQFKRLGVRGDWDNPYLTLAPEYEAAQIKVFGEMAKKGYIYKGLKPVYWCTDCQTALAEAEVEYGEKKSPSIFVNFPVKDGKGILPEDNTYVMIWTTTPWTLAANVAIALHPQFKYVLVETEKGKFLLARELVKSVMEKVELEYTVLQEFDGNDLELIVCSNPLLERDSLVILGDHVTLEQGTGCVHTAPGHGLEDYQVGQKYDLPIISPVNDKGVFTDEARQFSGMYYDKANKEVTKELEEKGYLFFLEFTKHQYPHCWRCKRPVIYRATEQWFASIDGFREAALNAIREVEWIPAWGEERIYNMVADRSDWCISRQRTWGVPIPILFCLDCNKEIINDETISHIENLFREHGSNVWFERTPKELLPEGFKCPHCESKAFKKETDIMDVWFDSGSSHEAVCANHPDLRWPADIYLEGSDQHRGWFNSSLSTAVATRGTAPYKQVLTHGYVVDEKGRKMSKSLGNGVDPLKVIEQMGADILRLWVSSADYRRDVAASPGIMKQITESYRKIRNTFRFLLSNLYDYDPEQHKVDYDNLSEVDKWALLKTHKLIDRVTKAYNKYEFHVVHHSVHNFCVVDMSSFYLDVCKDRLYTMPADHILRRSSQTVIYEVLTSLVKILMPVLAFTTEEIWSYLPKRKDDPISVQLAQYPEVNESYMDVDLETKWEKILDLREEVSKALELARQKKIIGHSLDASIQIYTDKDMVQILKGITEPLDQIFIVSSVEVKNMTDDIPEDAYKSDEVEAVIVVDKALGEKCERCWKYSEGSQEVEETLLCPRCLDVTKTI
ncbi:MAG: isoleucine--tRNA ligase [Desulfitibacter sp. BRH_c19]|nr:MAG: isoleucine--tRNA ligase [Desulfitibacter sp. BRH_c19]